MRRRTDAQAAVPVAALSLLLAGCAGTAGTSTGTAAGGGSEKGPVAHPKLQHACRAQRLALLAAGLHDPDLAPVAQA